MNSSAWKYFVLLLAGVALFFIWRSDLQNIRKISIRKSVEFLNNVIDKLNGSDVFDRYKGFDALVFTTGTFFTKSCTEGRIIVPLLFGVITSLIGCKFATVVKVFIFSFCEYLFHMRENEGAAEPRFPQKFLPLNCKSVASVQYCVIQNVKKKVK